MKLDLSVMKITNVSYKEKRNGKWERDVFRPRIFDAIVFFTKGEIEYHFADQNLVAREGDVLLLPGNVPYSGKRHTEDVSYFVLDFTCFSDSELASLGAPLAVRAENHEQCRAAFKAAVDAWNGQMANADFKIKSILFSLLSEVLVFKEAKRHDKQSEAIIAYVSENFCDPSLTVKSLCQLFFISESQLRRKICKITGTSPNSYIAALRINKAKNELTHTSKTVKQISAECGFSSQYYFSRCFSAITGISPTEYRTLTCI